MKNLQAELCGTFSTEQLALPSASPLLLTSTKPQILSRRSLSMERAPLGAMLAPQGLFLYVTQGLKTRRLSLSRY